MKYAATRWGSKDAAAHIITVGPEVPNETVMSKWQHTFIATFPIQPPNDTERAQRAYMLAKKLVAFLNALEEKKEQLIELMTIGEQP